MSEVTVHPYSSSDDRLWDEFLKSAKNTTFLCSRKYLSYHQNRFVDCSLIFKKKEKVVAIFPASRHGGEVISHGGITYGGLIYNNSLRTVDVLEIFNLMRDHYRDLAVTKLIYKAIPSVYKNYPSEDDLFALQYYGARLIRRDLASVIKLKDRPKFSDSRKNTIKKAKDKGIKVIDSESVEDFHALLTEVLSRYNVAPVHSIDELNLLKSLFSEQIKFYLAYHNEELLAGVMLFDFGHVIHTQNMASSALGRDSGALDLILATLVEQYYSDRTYFSFGISTENMGTYLNVGLNAQKEGFGGRGVVHDFYEWNI